MSKPSRSRNNLLAGTFLLVSLAIFLVISVIFSGVGEQLASSRVYVVRFPVAVGAPGLTGGSAVTLGGQNVGRVTDVGFARDEAGVPFAVDVSVRVRSELTLHEDARFELVRPLVGAGTLVNIASPGGGPSVLDEGGIVAGTAAAPAFLSDAGFGAEQQAQLRSIFASAEQATADLASTTRAVSEQLPEAIEDVRFAAGRARELLDASADFEDQIGQTLATIDRAAIGTEGAIEEARAALENIRATVATNRQTLTQVIDSLGRTSERVENELLDDFAAAVAEARRTTALASSAAEEADGMLRGQRPNIERTLANFRIASDQVKLTAIEARAAPWRLLNKPTRKEIAEQLVYDAAQAYLLASVELAQVNDTLAATVERAAQRAPGSQDDEIAALRAQLAASVERYEEAAEALLDRLDEG